MSTSAYKDFLQNKPLTRNEAEELTEKLTEKAMTLVLCNVSEVYLNRFMESKLEYENNFFRLKEPYNKKILDTRFEYSHSEMFYFNNYMRVFIRDLYKCRSANGTKFYKNSAVEQLEECKL